MNHLSHASKNGNPRCRSGKDTELRAMSAIMRLLSGTTAPARDAILRVIMQPLTERDVEALRTLTRLLGTLDAGTAERVRRWVHHRFAPPAPTTGAKPWSRPS